MSTLTIVLADDHHMIRNGLRLLLESKLDCAIKGEAATGPEAVSLVEQVQPDILIIELMLPGMSGLDVTRRVRQVAPHTHVVVLSMHADEAYAREALRAGATAYVLKESLTDEFVRAIRQAAAGQRYLSPPLAERMIAEYVQPTNESAPDLYATLTARERDVLYLIAQGLTSAAIAQQLTIGVRTVDWHRANMMRKLGLHSVAEVIRYATQRGIIPSEP
jgi:DNA-binding NarL/FixJ family response regulator